MKPELPFAIEMIRTLYVVLEDGNPSRFCGCYVTYGEATRKRDMLNEAYHRGWCDREFEAATQPE